MAPLCGWCQKLQMIFDVRAQITKKITLSQITFNFFSVFEAKTEPCN
tara:strand:+ start:1558 stop:1698 length:141 start_codon:yes stop_codon:yes gene_type:complete